VRDSKIDELSRLWVKSRHCGISNQCPLYPQKRTLELSREMSALRQKRTHAPQQTVFLFDYLISASEQWQRHRDAERLGGLEVDSEFNLGRLHNR
jgi:hypothetical protein